MTDSPYIIHAPGMRLRARPLPLCAGEVAEIERTPLEHVSWGAVAVLALVLGSIAALGALAYLLATQ